MELAAEAFALEPRVNRVDPVRRHEGRAVASLREEVPQWTIHRARRSHRVAVARDERERAVDPCDGFGKAAGDAGARFLDAHVVDPVHIGIHQVHHLLDFPLVHAPPPPEPEFYRL